MKGALLLFLLLFSYNIIYSQNTGKAMIPVDNGQMGYSVLGKIKLPDEEAFKAARRWIEDSLRDKNFSFIIENDLSINLEGKFEMHLSDGDAVDEEDNQVVNFKVGVYCKNGKGSIRLYEFQLHAASGNPEYEYDLYLKGKQPQKFWQQFWPAFAAKNQMIVSILKQKLSIMD